MNPYYDKLINFDGAQGLDRLIRKWAVLSSNLKTLPVNGPILIPDLFVVSHSNTMLSRMIDTLSSYLITQKNLLDFNGDIPCFEFMLNYCPPGAGFKELERLIDGISDCAGYRNEFRGIVHIKLDYWLGHQEEHHFIDLLDYLSENTFKWLIILSVSTKNEDKASAMESVLSMFLRIERVTLHRASTTTYVGEIEDLLGDYGFSLDDSAKELLSASIDVLRGNRYFDSVGAVDLFGSDIIYELYSRNDMRPGVLSAQDLQTFSKDSNYIKRTLQKVKKRIGFA